MPFYIHLGNRPLYLHMQIAHSRPHVIPLRNVQMGIMNNEAKGAIVLTIFKVILCFQQSKATTGVKSIQVNSGFIQLMY